MVAFGGAGPVHAAGLARSLGMQRVLVPFGAGVTSAIGLLSAKPKFDLARSYVSPLEPEMLEPVNRLFADMLDVATRQLRAAGASEPFVIERSAHMRYEGQGYDIEVRMPGADELTADDLAELRSAFDREYATAYGYAEPHAVVRATDWYLTAIGTWPELQLSRGEEVTGADARPAPSTVRPVYFPETGWVRECPVYDRYALPPGAQGDGPAIVEERESTTVVPPGCAWRVDAQRTLIIELGGDAR
jgi:N-methylhydantoinase A